MITYQNIYHKSQEEVLCHPAEKVQAQVAPVAEAAPEAAVPAAEAAPGAAAPAVGAAPEAVAPAVGAVTKAARQEGGAAHRIAVPTVAHIEALLEATIEVHRHIP